MRTEEVQSDITIVGGGLAGCCAAIAAARQGARVALIQNRPVLGGNSSSEIRVWVCGATSHGTQHYARETGIMGELFVENQFTNPEGNPYYWDLVVLEAVRAEPNIRLFLNTDVREVEASGPESDRRIDAVTGWMMGSERVIRFLSPAFIDCSGDGLVGHLAGARTRTGREAFEEHQEDWAPEEADGVLLGSTILFYSKDAGRPVPFVAPSFAKDIGTTAIPKRRRIRADHNGCDFWWIEWGGEHDIVHDNEEIRDELQAAVYGIWDYIKNSGEYDAANLTLDWIGAIPGKREYRRFVGDHVLTQHDILGQPEFEDRVAFGGWSIDLHPRGGMYADEPGSRHWYPDGTYHIPLRSLYSQNVSNMWMAGRTISASHVAFGSTRVMATCAVGGEAAGTAAALAVRRGITPRELTSARLDEVHHAMVRSDGPLLGVRATDPADLALGASVTASSTLKHLSGESAGWREPLDSHLGLVIPVDPSLGSIDFLVDAADDTELIVDVYGTGKPQNYLPVDRVHTASFMVAAGQQQWVTVPTQWFPEQAQNAFLVLRRQPLLSVHGSARGAPGILAFRHREPPSDEPNVAQWRAWKHLDNRQSLCFRLQEQTEAFRPEMVSGRYARPWGGPQMWVSEPLVNDEQPWVELTWDEPVTIAEVALVLDDDVEEDLINLHHHRTPEAVVPTLLCNYEIHIHDETGWRTIITVRANRRRHRVHQLETAVTTQRLRVVAQSNHGAPRAHLISLRTYSDTRSSV